MGGGEGNPWILPARGLYNHWVRAVSSVPLPYHRFPPKDMYLMCSRETLPKLSCAPPGAPSYHYPQLNMYSVKEKKVLSKTHLENTTHCMLFLELSGCTWASEKVSKDLGVLEREYLCHWSHHFPNLNSLPCPHLHPQAYQHFTGHWYSWVECSESAFSGIKVLHLLATWKGWWRLKILTTRTYLISWEFIFLLKFGFLVQLFSFCPIILLIETSSVLGNNCFVTPVKKQQQQQKHFRRPLRLRIWTEIKHKAH